MLFQEDSISHFMDLPMELLECPHHMAAAFPPRELSEREREKKYYLASEVIYPHFCCVLLITQIDQDTVCVGTTQGHKYQDVGIMQGHLEGLLPKSP